MTMIQFLLVLTLAAELAGLIVSGLLLFDAKRDLDAVQRYNIANGRRLVARGAYVTETFRLATLVLFVGASLISTDLVWSSITISSQLMLAFALQFFAVMGIVSQSIAVYVMRRRLFDGERSRMTQDT